MTDLTPRELEVARLVGVECLSSKGAARVLGIGDRTIEVHRRRIFEKLGVHNVAELARYMALEEGK